MRNDKDRTKTMNTDRDMEGSCGASTSSFFLRRDRGGTVLVIVVAILAVLMVFAATLALTSRVEKKASENYEIDEMLGHLTDSVRMYAVDNLEEHRYDRAGSGFAFSDSEPPIENDVGGKSDVLGTISSGDWTGGGEFGWGENLAGGEFEGQFVLHFEDLGGRTLDVNMTGNWDKDIEEHIEGEGETTFRTRLSDITEEDTVLYQGRGYGSSSGDAEAEFYGYDYAGKNKFPYHPEYPDSDDFYPFGSGDFYDCVIGSFYQEYIDQGETPPEDIKEYVEDGNWNSWLGQTLYDASILQHLNTAGATSVIAGVEEKADDLDGSAALDYDGDWLEKGDEEILLQRPLPQIVRTLEDNLGSSDGVKALRDLLNYVDELESEDNFEISPDNRSEIIDQVALNMWNMAAHFGYADPVYEWNGYGGVVPETPYIAEVEAAIDTGSDSFLPDPDADLSASPPESRLDNVYERGADDADDADLYFEDGDGDNDGVWDKGDEGLWHGNQDYDSDDDANTLISEPEPDNGTTGEEYTEADNPSTGWGKYIKMVNPWADKIDDMENYSIEISNCERWSPAESPTDTNTWNEEYVELTVDYSTGDWAVSSGDSWDNGDNGDSATITIDFSDISGKEIPAQGHFVIADSTDAVPSGLASDNYAVIPYINYMRDDSVLTLKYEGDAVMEFDMDESEGTGESDKDNQTNDDSMQIGDPRPCLMRDIGDGNEFTDHSDPWAMGAGNVKKRTVGEWTDNTRDFAWFNRNWRHDSEPAQQVDRGDNWYLIYADSLNSEPQNDHNLLDSFDLPAKGLLSPADLTYVHTGISWGTLSPSRAVDDQGDPQPDKLGAKEIVFFDGLSRYLIGNSPYEHGDDGLAIYCNHDPVCDPQESNDPCYDHYDSTDIVRARVAARERLGHPIRLHGRVNVNTAPQEVLEALIPRNVISKRGDVEVSWNSTEEKWEVQHDSGMQFDDTGDTSDGGYWEVIYIDGEEYKVDTIDSSTTLYLTADSSDSHLSDIANTVVEYGARAYWGMVDSDLNDSTEVDNVVNDIARAIVHERHEDMGGPFENLDDFLDRIPELIGTRKDREDSTWDELFGDYAGRHTWDLGDLPNTPLRHAMARSLYNRITVRTDVWGVTGRVQLLDDGDVVSERAFYMVVDRSFLQPRVILKTDLPLD